MNEKEYNKISLIQLNSYVKPTIKEEMGKDWVLNGKNNSFFDDVIDRYNGSPTNAAIINGYSEMIYGKGLTAVDDSILKLFPSKDIRKICNDFELFGSASFQVIYSKGKGALRKVTGVYHIPRQTIAPNKMNDEGEITTYWYCKDWSKASSNKPEPYPAFGTSKEDKEIYVIEPYKAGKYYYADPDYLACMQYAQLEEEISNFSINHIRNGLSAGFIINLNNGVPEKEVRNEIERDIKKKVTGSSAAGNVVVSFNDNAETKATIEAFPSNENHKQWDFWCEEARKQIMVGHRVTSPMLFGIKDNTGLGNNAEELETASKLSYATVIQPKQELILDAFNEVVKYNGIDTELEFKPLISFTKEDGGTTKAGEEVELHSHYDDSFVADALIEVGEDIKSLEGWELIDESKVIKDPTAFELKLAKTFSSSWASASEQDNELFKVRYVYAPNAVSDNSREFCRKMVNADKVYRKEDIILAQDKVVNEGFGAGGADTYSIWLYKGGVNCAHFWQRQIYLKKNNGKISVTEARKMILDLEPSERNDARLPINEKEVAQTAGSNNNYWKLQ
ncbi:hypothetical protein [Galbibacter pacificus]|uniref:Phage portal protein n=1 Tax=Galbibacter pacificus TaxID=2996052 RepID=A0ABT6FQD6_9FLAO|nr:hypothetical protein [Galbibacter pacificus]MDG3582053.1 hypothetical protein [Galbibacter pacificus]MDG3585473.1 hypothetical protein [Galbibacter pacificus]